MLLFFNLICSYCVTSADYVKFKEPREIHEAGHMSDCFTKATKVKLTLTVNKIILFNI